MHLKHSLWSYIKFEGECKEGRREKKKIGKEFVNVSVIVYAEKYLAFYLKIK